MHGSLDQGKAGARALAPIALCLPPAYPVFHPSTAQFVDTPLVAKARAESGPKSTFYKATGGRLLTADKVAEAAHVLIADPKRVGQCLVVRMSGEWMEPQAPGSLLQ